MVRYIIWGAPDSGSGIVEAACAALGVDYALTEAVRARPKLATVWARHIR